MKKSYFTFRLFLNIVLIIMLAIIYIYSGLTEDRLRYLFLFF